MKNFYFFQVNYSYGRSAHLPYTAALLACYALNDPAVKENYALRDIFFLRDNPEKLLAKMEDPAFVGFSTYIWNFEFNKYMARIIREKYPSCVIVFGGHNVEPGGGLLEEEYIDYLIHGEGEEAFRRLMLVPLGLDDPEKIDGVSYRENGKIHTNPSIIKNEEYIDQPSPYLEGYFDKILEEYPDKDFMALIETSRGCPNSCAYCDWSNMKSRIRKFPTQRVLDEIRWISEHKILGLGSADSNFGIFERDEEITAFLVKMYTENHRPVAFQTSYAKNSNERIFRIGSMLEKYRLSKGITLSFQSMDDTVLKNIGRKNIPVSHYKELMDMYTAAGIPTYTELILGLPGETYESFANGIYELLDLGQHNAIYIHNCEHLPCAVMGNKDYIEKFGIKSAKILLNQPHIEPDSSDRIPEYSHLIVETNSMSRDDWAEMNMISFIVQCFHHMGVMQLFALYLHAEKNVSYKEFYENLKDWVTTDCKTLTAAVQNINSKLADISKEKENSSFVINDSRFGKVMWPFEEYLYLCVAAESETFYEESKTFIKRFDDGDGVLDSLLEFQKKMLKRPFYSGEEFHSNYNFCDYFSSALKGEKAELIRGDYSVTIMAQYYDDPDTFAKEVAWYGRKNNKNIYIDDAVERKIN